jgi:hypothetical protein
MVLDQHQMVNQRGEGIVKGTGVRRGDRRGQGLVTTRGTGAGIRGRLGLVSVVVVGYHVKYLIGWPWCRTAVVRYASGSARVLGRCCVWGLRTIVEFPIARSQ